MTAATCERCGKPKSLWPNPECKKDPCDWCHGHISPAAAPVASEPTCDCDHPAVCAHCEPTPRPASRADEVTTLIERAQKSFALATAPGTIPMFVTPEERDVHVLALRVLRVLQDWAVFVRAIRLNRQGEIRVELEMTPGFVNNYSLDDAERLLGIVTDDGDGGEK